MSKKLFTLITLLLMAGLLLVACGGETAAYAAEILPVIVTADHADIARSTVAFSPDHVNPVATVGAQVRHLGRLVAASLGQSHGR